MIKLDHLVADVKETYEKHFLTSTSIEQDIIDFNVNIYNCINAFVSVQLGHSLIGGSPVLEIVKNKPIIFDGDVVFENPTAQELFAVLIAFHTENGNPLDYIKVKE